MTASQAQRTKFNTFMERADAQSLIECAVHTVFAAGLDLDGMGVRWGMTGCVDQTSYLRLNVGQRVLLDIAPQGIDLFAVHPRNTPAPWRYGGVLYGGFPEVKDSIRLVARDPHDLIDLLADHPDLAAAVRLHAEASPRPLPRSEWHNPLLNDLITTTATAVLQGRRHLARPDRVSAVDWMFDIGPIDVIARSRRGDASREEVDDAVKHYLEQRPAQFDTMLATTHAHLFALVAGWANAPEALLHDHQRLFPWLANAVRLAELAEPTPAEGADVDAEPSPDEGPHRPDNSLLMSKLEEVIALDPDHAGHRSRLGDLRRRIGDFEGAATAYREAIELEPENAVHHAALADVLSLEPDGPLAEIVEHYRQAMQCDPKNAELLLQYTQWLGDMASSFDPSVVEELEACGFDDMWNDIRAVLTRGLELEPHNPALHHMFGETFVMEDLMLQGEGHLEAALPHYTRAIELDPADDSSRFALAEVLRDLDDLEGAEAHFRQLLAHLPDHMHATHGLAMVLSAAERHDEALPLHRRAVSLCANCSEFQVGLGDCLRTLGHSEEAVAAYLAAMEASHQLGTDIFLEDAVDLGTKLLRLDPRHIAGHSRLALVLDDVGAVDEATVHHRRVIELIPEFKSEWVRLISRLQQLEADDLVSMFEWGLEADADNADLYLLVARLLVRDGLTALAEFTNE